MSSTRVVTVLGLAGSPRLNGNTDTLLDRSLAAAEAAGASVTRIRLCDLTYSYCHACDGCRRDGVCVRDDDMGVLFPLLRGADSILLAAPVHSLGLPAHAKAMVDRCQPFWVMKHVLGVPVVEAGRRERRGGFLSCAGTDSMDVFGGTTRVVRYLWHVLEVQPAGEILCPGVDASGDIARSPAAGLAAEDLGKRLAEKR